MAKEPEFDLQVAHRYFSATCFNQAWELIDKPERTAEEDEAMVQLSLASTWHWTQREDCTPANLSIGYWQTARIYTLIGQVGNARYYAQRCLTTCLEAELPPFYTAYAYEALARAEATAGNVEKSKEYLASAQKETQRVVDEDSRKMLLADLATIAD